jgi:hypothetical protein
LIQELRCFAGACRVAAEDYGDTRAIKLVEQTLKEARELLIRAQTELSHPSMFSALVSTYYLVGSNGSRRSVARGRSYPAC